MHCSQGEMAWRRRRLTTVQIDNLIAEQTQMSVDKIDIDHALYLFLAMGWRREDYTLKSTRQRLNVLVAVGFHSPR